MEQSVLGGSHFTQLVIMLGKARYGKRQVRLTKAEGRREGRDDGSGRRKSGGEAKRAGKGSRRKLSRMMRTVL